MSQLPADRELTLEPGEPDEAGSTRTTAGDVLTSLRRGKFIITFITSVAVVICLLALQFYPPSYTAEAVVSVDFRKAQVLYSPDIRGDMPAKRQTAWTIVWSEAERIKSWPIVSQLVEHVSLANEPSLLSKLKDGGLCSCPK